MSKILEFFSNLNFKLENAFDTLGSNGDRKSSAIWIAILGFIVITGTMVAIWLIFLR